MAIVTGAASGIGRAAAELFAAEGARVLCADINDASPVVDHIGSSAAATRVDVSIAADVSRMVDEALDAFGRLDILFNNAGFGGPRVTLPELDEDVFDRVIAVNLKSVYLGIKYGIPAMLRSGGGSVINTASAAGLVGFKNHAAYASAKGGVVQMTKSVALDYAAHGVRVNAICPGMTWTGLAHAAYGSSPPADSKPPQPMNRWGLPSELAAAALFLASDESSFITGAAIPVDGGYVAR